MDYLILIFLLIVLSFTCVFGVFMLYMLIKTGVPFIPTEDEVVNEMIAQIEFKDNQIIYELGCGNGKMLFAAKEFCDKSGKKNVKLRGYELIRPLIWWIKSKTKVAKLTTNKIEVFSRDFFKADLSDADVIFCYLFPHIMQRIFRKIFPKLKNGTIIVSHAFKIEDLKPKKIIKVAKTTLYIYEK